MAKISIRAEIWKRKPRNWLKNQQATALNTIHRAMLKLPKVSKFLEYKFASLSMGFNSIKALAKGYFNI